MTAKTNAERQRDYRARKTSQNTKEVRGIFLHVYDHAELKKHAAEIVRKRELWPNRNKARLMGGLVNKAKETTMNFRDDPYDKRTASREDRIAWALCQIIDDDAPMRWMRYRFAAECIAQNSELMDELITLRDMKTANG